MHIFIVFLFQVVADASANPAYVAADLLSQAEHGPQSQVVLVAVDLTSEQLNVIVDEIEKQTDELPRKDIVKKSLENSFILKVENMEQALRFSNSYAPEHLILNVKVNISDFESFQLISLVSEGNGNALPF